MSSDPDHHLRLKLQQLTPCCPVEGCSAALDPSCCSSEDYQIHLIVHHGISMTQQQQQQKKEPELEEDIQNCDFCDHSCLGSEMIQHLMEAHQGEEGRRSTDNDGAAILMLGPISLKEEKIHMKEETERVAEAEKEEDDTSIIGPCSITELKSEEEEKSPTNVMNYYSQHLPQSKVQALVAAAETKVTADLRRSPQNAAFVVAIAAASNSSMGANQSISRSIVNKRPETAAAADQPPKPYKPWLRRETARYRCKTCGGFERDRWAFVSHLIIKHELLICPFCRSLHVFVRGMVDHFGANPSCFTNLVSDNNSLKDSE